MKQGIREYGLERQHCGHIEHGWPKLYPQLHMVPPNPASSDSDHCQMYPLPQKNNKNKVINKAKLFLFKKFLGFT